MNYVAERKILFSEKGNHLRKEAAVRVSLPYIVQQASVEFPVDGIVACCHVTIEGLNVSDDVYGMDSLQALNLASDIDPLLKGLSDKYDFYWPTGEPSFEE